LGSYNGWAFDFRKLGAITMDVLTFLQSRKRKLTSGDIVPDSVSNLTGYRTGIRYLFKEEQKWSPNVVRSDDVETWENMMADFFKSLDKGETKLKRDGKLTTKTGGDKFPLKILGDTTMKLWDLGNFMAGLQHLLLFNTCGRTGAVSHVNTRHIVAVEDHIASTFPFTKGDQTGEAEGYMLSLYSTPHEGEAMFDINLALGLHLLSSGGFPRGRLFGGQARPEVERVACSRSHENHATAVIGPQKVEGSRGSGGRGGGRANGRLKKSKYLVILSFFIFDLFFLLRVVSSCISSPMYSSFNYSKYFSVPENPRNLVTWKENQVSRTDFSLPTIIYLLSALWSRSI
jgi:hypothetical protein